MDSSPAPEAPLPLYKRMLGFLKPSDNQIILTWIWRAAKEVVEKRLEKAAPAKPTSPPLAPPQPPPPPPVSASGGSVAVGRNANGATIIIGTPAASASPVSPPGQ